MDKSVSFSNGYFQMVLASRLTVIGRESLVRVKLAYSTTKQVMVDLPFFLQKLPISG